MANNKKQYQEFIIDGQPVHAPLGVSELEVRRFMQKQSQSKKPSATMTGPKISKMTQKPSREESRLESFIGGAGSEVAKSGAGLGQFVTGKQYNLPEEPQNLGPYQRYLRFLGKQAAGMGKTAAGVALGSKLGSPFGPTGRAVGGLIGAVASHYLTQPGERLSKERALAGAQGGLEAVLYGTGHPERKEIEGAIREIETREMPRYASDLTQARSKQAGLSLEKLQMEKELAAPKEQLTALQRQAKKETGRSELGSLERKKELLKEKTKINLEGEQPISASNFPIEGQGPADVAKQQAKAAETELTKIFTPKEGEPTHQTNIHNLLKEDLAQKQSALGQEYQDFKKTHAGQVIKEGYVKDANQIIAELPDPTSMELFGVGAESAEETASKINRQLVPITKDVNTLFDNWRSLKRYSQRARGKARTRASGLSEDEKTKLTNAADKWDAAAAKIAKVLEDNNYGKSLDELKNLNTRYANEYAPIYDTSAYWYMDKEGKAPPNFLDNIEGNTKGKKILQEAVKNNQNILKSALGQAIEDNPKIAIQGYKKTLLNPYVKSHAESKPYFEQLNTALGKLPAAEIEQAELIKESLSLQKSAEKIKTAREAEINIQKIDDHIEKIDKVVSAIEAKQKQIKDIELKQATENIEKLKIKQKNIAAQQKLDALKDQRKKLALYKVGVIRKFNLQPKKLFTTIKKGFKAAKKIIL
jgi:hypothetical protein